MEIKEKIKKEIGERIEFIRINKNMTKEEFAKLINITGGVQTPDPRLRSQWIYLLINFSCY